MPSGTVCSLLLPFGGPAVSLNMDAFSRLTLLALGEVALPLSLLATYETLVVAVPAVTLWFHASSLGTLA